MTFCEGGGRLDCDAVEDATYYLHESVYSQTFADSGNSHKVGYLISIVSPEFTNLKFMDHKSLAGGYANQSLDSTADVVNTMTLSR